MSNILKTIQPLESIKLLIATVKKFSAVKNLHTSVISYNKTQDHQCKSSESSTHVREKSEPRDNVGSENVENASATKRRQNCRPRGSVSVTVVGGGRTAAFTGLLLKQNPDVKEVRLIDTDDSLAPVVCDLRQIDTTTVVRHFHKSSLLDGLRNTDIVALMDESDFTAGTQGPFSQFALSCNYVKSVAECLTNVCPNALVAVFAQPVTATLPLVLEIYKQSGNLDFNKIIGSAALQSMRIANLTATFLDLNPACLTVPIAGGVDSLTIVPLLSRTRPFNYFSLQEHCRLTEQLRSADRELAESESKGPSLSRGMAVAKFISTLINGIKGRGISIANAFVRSDSLPGCKYTTSELRFGPDGIAENFGLPKISPLEVALVERAVPVINKLANSATCFVATGKIK